MCIRDRSYTTAAYLIAQLGKNYSLPKEKRIPGNILLGFALETISLSLIHILVAEGAIHAVRLKQKSKAKRKKKIAAAIYEYQADCDGEWGEISLDFKNGKAEVILLADWDTLKTNKFVSRAIAYLPVSYTHLICHLSFVMSI